MGIGFVFLIILASIVANAVTFFIFDGPAQPDVTFLDAVWYSVVSITTIGYGDLSASSLGARIGTIFFIIVIGLTAFTSGISLLVDWILDYQQRERLGMLKTTAKDHLIIVNFPSESRIRQIIEEFNHDPQHRDLEEVILSDQIESLPIAYPNLTFVKGSPLEEATYVQANIFQARRAIILSTSYDDPTSDSVAASVVTLMHHLNPGLHIVAECLDPKHALLFNGDASVTLVYPLQIANNLLVQEAQDPGVNLLAQAIISNQVEGTLASTRAEDGHDGSMAYIDIAKNLLDHGVNLTGVVRRGKVHVSFDDLLLAEGDRLVYISAERYAWPGLRPLIV